MTRMKYITLLVISFLAACSFAIKKMGGIRNPKLESFNSINSYSYSLGLDTFQVVFTKDSTSCNEVSKAFGLSSPEMIIFNNSGTFIPYKNDEKSCNATVENSLGNICNIEKNEFSTQRKINWNRFEEFLDDPNHAININVLKEYDFIVVMNFTKYYDGINKTHLIPWNKIINENKNDCKIKYIYVNQDYLTTWKITSKIPKIKVKIFNN
jgi:hypothetical protein